MTLQFQLCRPQFWIFQFQFLPPWLSSVDICSMGMSDPENNGLAVEITLLSDLGAGMRWGSIVPLSRLRKFLLKLFITLNKIN